MSRSISISYEGIDGTDVSIEIPAPYDLLGCQETGTQFWGIPRLREIGIERLTSLETGAVGFWGWEDLEVLHREIDLLARHLSEIDFHRQLKVEWLSHLTYCYYLLCETAPKQSIPALMIG